MAKILAFFLALLLLFSWHSHRVEVDVTAISDIFIPRHLIEDEPIAAVVTHIGKRINVYFYADKLNHYLWDLKFDNHIVELEQTKGNDFLSFRIRKYEESSMYIRLVLHGQLYCPKYILKIDIPADKEGEVLYTQIVPEYAQGKREEKGLIKVFFRELFSGG